MNHYTITDVMGWNPCYSMKKVKELFAGRRTITLLDVLDMDIPHMDKCWVAEEMEPELWSKCQWYMAPLPWLREQLERETDPVLERLETVEKDLNRQLKEVRYAAFNSSTSLNARLETLEAKEQPNVCEGCLLDITCDHARSKICNIGGDGHPFCYKHRRFKLPEKPKTPVLNCKDCVKSLCKWCGLDREGFVSCYVEKPKTERSNIHNCRNCGEYDCRFNGFDKFMSCSSFVKKPETCTTCMHSWWRGDEGHCCWVNDQENVPAGRANYQLIWRYTKACPKHKAIP